VRWRGLREDVRARGRDRPVAEAQHERARDQCRRRTEGQQRQPDRAHHEAVLAEAVSPRRGGSGRRSPRSRACCRGRRATRTARSGRRTGSVRRTRPGARTGTVIVAMATSAWIASVAASGRRVERHRKAWARAACGPCRRWAEGRAGRTCRVGPDSAGAAAAVSNHARLICAHGGQARRGHFGPRQPDRPGASILAAHVRASLRLKQAALLDLRRIRATSS